MTVSASREGYSRELNNNCPQGYPSEPTRLALCRSITHAVGCTTRDRWASSGRGSPNTTAATIACPGQSGGPAPTYTYDASNALTARTGQPAGAFAYDGNGAEIRGAGAGTRTNGTWTPRNQLSTLTIDGSAHTYTYASEGNKERTAFDTTLGRFTQPDPSGQETNNYTYAEDNPISGSDPTGLCGKYYTADCTPGPQQSYGGDFFTAIGRGLNYLYTATAGCLAGLSFFESTTYGYTMSIPYAGEAAAVGACAGGATLAVNGARNSIP